MGWILLSPGRVWPDDHLQDIDKVRVSMTEMGYKLPEAIRATKPDNIRTLERVFEINNYALVTIESYLKMLKVFSLSSNRNFKDTLPVLNGWLTFIASYCESDIKYLEAARAEMNGDSERAIVSEEATNITRLMEAAQKGIGENSRAFGKL
jgi:hypothetical protein